MTTPKRPRDPNQFAKFIVDAATREPGTIEETGLTKRARAGGQRGGLARALALTSAKRSEIASAANQARWKKSD